VDRGHEGIDRLVVVGVASDDFHENVALSHDSYWTIVLRDQDAAGALTLDLLRITS
jgi:hypothetical protein